MQSEGPYSKGSEVFYTPENSITLVSEPEIVLANAAHAEGRKEAENYTEKMLVIAKDEVRKCHEEIRRLEDKYARNVYKMPPYNPSFDEKEHAALVEKGTLAVQVIGKSDKDFRELLEMANTLSQKRLCRGEIHDKFDTWKKARGIE